MNKDSTKKEISSLKFKVEHLERVQDNMVQYVKDMKKAALNAVQSELKKMKRKLDDCEEENRRLRSELQDEQTRVSNLEREIDVMRAGGPRFMIVEEE